MRRRKHRKRSIGLALSREEGGVPCKLSDPQRSVGIREAYCVIGWACQDVSASCYWHSESCKFPVPCLPSNLLIIIWLWEES